MNSERVFQPPPEAPVISPTAEQFRDTIAFLSSLQPLLLKHGIVKIRPPPTWKPPFCINKDKFSFKPRVQQINELEAQTRVKLEFLDRLAKFWELQGQAFKVPMVDRKPLDMATLFKNAVAEGGFEEVTKNRKWRKICCKMNLGSAVSAIKHHYEKYLYPYERFLARDNKICTPTSTPKSTPTTTPTKRRDVEVSPGKTLRYTVGAHSMVATATTGGRDSPHSSSSPVGSKKLRHAKSAGKEDSDIIDLSNLKTTKELRKLQFLAPGPKALLSDLTPRNNTDVAMAIRRKRLASLDLDPDFSISEPHQKVSCMTSSDDSIASRTRRSRPSPKRSPQKNAGGYVEVCQECEGFGQQEEILTCCQCAASYHTYCMDPPWEGVPNPQWRCPVCIAEEYNKPPEVFGFEQASKEYTLREYLEMANKFKEEYFLEPIIKIPCSVVEREYWTVVSELDSGVIVEYGADLHSSKHGSGFPVPSKARSEEEKYYANSGWNLNNLPVLEGSVLQYIQSNISGMKVPWVYAGMCFSSFCWHTEDHWMCSINYLHCGQPKTWYGVPPSYAEALEQTIREVAPELFEAQPDLMHHLVTILSPNELMKNNIPVVRADQCEGEFIVTGPRAYHAGFNQGFNVAEAVNFALPEWIPYGRKSMDHYSSMRRKPVFSHDELICMIAQQPNKLCPSLQLACYQDLKEMIREQEDYFQAAASMGVDPTGYERMYFEKLPDQQRECCYCHTMCFVAVFKCSCMLHSDHIACLRHISEHGKCLSGEIFIRYRYTVKELRALLTQLQNIVNPMKDWDADVKKRLSTKKEDIVVLRELLIQGRQLSKTHHYESEVVDVLSNVIQEAEMCEKIAQHLMTYTNAAAMDKEVNAMLSFNEVKNVAKKFEGLPCTIEHGEQLMSCFKKVEELSLRLAIEKEIAQRTLELGDYRVNSCTESLHQEYLKCGVVIVVGEQLKVFMALKKWCHEGERFTSFSDDDDVKLMLSDAEDHLKRGEDLKLMKALNSKVLEKHLTPMRSLIQNTLNLNENLQQILKLSKWESVESVDELVQTYQSSPFQLGAGEELVKLHTEVSQWVRSNDCVAKMKGKLLTVQDAKTLLSQGLSLPVSLSCVSVLQEKLDIMQAWISSTEKAFLCPNSQASLLEVLLPRSSPSEPVFKKVNADTDGSDRSYTFTEVLGKLSSYEKAIRMIREREHRDEAFFEKLRSANTTTESGRPPQVCRVCSKPLVTSVSIQCHLCLSKHHFTCVSQMSNNFLSISACSNFFLCSACLRTQRPHYDKAVALYKEGTSIGIYTPEVAALGCLVFRANEWQKTVTPLIQKANQIMSSILPPETPSCSTPPSSSSIEKPKLELDLFTTADQAVKQSGKYCTVAVQTDSDDITVTAVSQQEASHTGTSSTDADSTQLLSPPVTSLHAHIGSSTSVSQGHMDVLPLTTADSITSTGKSSVGVVTDDNNTDSKNVESPVTELPSKLRMELYQQRLKGACLEVHLSEMDQLNFVLAQDNKLTKPLSNLSRFKSVHSGDMFVREVKKPSTACNETKKVSDDASAEVYITKVEAATCGSTHSNSFKLLSRQPCTLREKRSHSEHSAPIADSRTSVIADPSASSSNSLAVRRRFSLPASSVSSFMQSSSSHSLQSLPASSVYQVLNPTPHYQTQTSGIMQHSGGLVQHGGGLVQSLQQGKYIQPIPVSSTNQPTVSTFTAACNPDHLAQQMKRMTQQDSDASRHVYMMLPNQLISQGYTPPLQHPSQPVQPVAIPTSLVSASQLSPGVMQATGGKAVLPFAAKRPPSPELGNGVLIQSKKPAQVGVHLVQPQPVVAPSPANQRFSLSRNIVLFPQGSQPVHKQVHTGVIGSAHRIGPHVMSAGQTFIHK